ncbi:hypothetical protein V2A60_002498 [Cordyceps javanica]|uniref:von Willebrand domain-containing protein n=1 Tax=Cordyceps javanica TaxID=43265 RepID=A0A545VL49_9HYPO|nr:von Willebrand domain-containing protein [Cordyceps javanica]TQW02453.1 von Willebrand domain-containing protein [Cordyceps javanica]
MSRFRRPALYPSISGDYCGCIVIVNNERKFLPLIQVDAHATLLASTSRTTLTQTFKNPTAQHIKESRYVFPLFDGVSVVAFTCTIGKTVIQGVVKSKPEAKKEFDAAVAQGQQAGLLEQSDRASDVFTTALGNVGPDDEVKVQVTFLGELKHDAEVDGLRYTIPTHIAPRYADDFVVPIPAHDYSTAKDASLSVTIDVDLATGTAIKSVQSPSHPISVNIGTTSTRPNDDPSLQYASASLTRSDVQLDKDFIVQVCAKGLGDPSAVLETHAAIPSRRAIMATLVPRFNLAVEKPEVVFICDRSGSMDTGTRLANLVASLQVFLRSLPVGVLFNICSFGSSHAFLWPKSQPYNQATLDEAAAHVKSFAANYGGTRIREPIEATFDNRDKSRNLEAFLMTDGETWDEQATFEAINRAVKEARGTIRVFALGVGADASHSLIEGVARAGRGFAQSVGENENMSKKVVRMLKGALTPHIDDYRLEIKYEKTDDDDFELVEKVSECTLIGSGREAEAEAEAEAEQPVKPTISLHDTSVADQDLEMPDVQALPLPALPTPTYLQAPHTIPPLFPFSRTSVYVLLSESRAHRTPKSVVLRGTAPQGPLELEIPVEAIGRKGTTIHQLAARKAVQDLEEGRGWVYDAKVAGGKMVTEEYAMRMGDIAREAAVKLGVEYQVAGKWCSFVAVKKTTEHSAPEAGEPVRPTPEKKKRKTSASSLGKERPELCDEDDSEGEYEMGFGAQPASLDASDSIGKKHRSMPRMRALSRGHVPAPKPASLAMGRESFSPHMSVAAPRSYGFGADATSASFASGGVQHHGFGGGGGGGGSPSLFGGSALNSVSSSGLFSKPAPRALACKSAAAPRKLPAFACRKVQFDGNNDGEEEEEDEEDEHGIDEDADSAKTPPLEAIIALQTFSGSWAWSAALTQLLGVTSEAAGAQLQLQQVAGEATATLCAIAYLRTKLADQEEVWELVVDKARDWLVSTLELCEDDVKALEDKAIMLLA